MGRAGFWLVGVSMMVGMQVSAQVLTSTPEEQKSLAVTVYNSNLGLVRDVRTLTIPKGVQSLRFGGVAAQINPATVFIKSLSQPQGLNILEQNYEYDLLTPAKLLDKYVGRKITLVLKQTENNTEKFIPTEALLLANNEGQVYQIGNQIIVNPTNIAEIRFPQLPDGLIAKPTLIWKLDNDTAGAQTVEASYLTGGLNWRADYVFVLNPKETQADLKGWVTLTNESGTEYRNAQLQLVAGDVNRVREDADKMAADGGNMMLARKAEAFKQEDLFEYHLYTLERPTTLKNAQTKQINLLEAQGIKVKKEFILSGQAYYYQNYNQPGVPIKEKVGVFIQFTNGENNKLGQPLPAGIIRLYKADSQGNQQFIGEDRIDHTPRNEDVKVKVGDAFDIVAERKQSDYKRISDKVTEYAYEINVRNRKKEAVTIQINEAIFGDWDVVSASFPWQKTSASAARFTVPVKANEAVTLSYRVRVKF
jgi:hypothetical protein